MINLQIEKSIDFKAFTNIKDRCKQKLDTSFV